eukprot:TRINITY_DN3836_c0_g1_i2.p1 TRINITY_DN3836_c0_g1~~TRINITY_DN3836_c0_g1_i2.p1  ORF type:complete len:696 (-),score=215.08 TRINITY_DN3836_c0_g1_i2:75-2162(-)
MTSRDEADVRSSKDLDNAKADYDMTDEWIANPNEDYTDLRSDLGLERGTILKDELAPKDIEMGENKAIEATLKADGGPVTKKHEVDLEQNEDLEDDFVVKEFDVHFSQQLSNCIYLLQYPLRPKWKPYDKTNLSEVRFKPKGLKLEMGFSVDKSSELYDPENTTGYKKFVLTSSTVPLRTNFAVGVIRGDEVHLTPILPPNCGVLQMRPSFSHLVVPKAEKEVDQKGEEEEEEAAENDEEIRPLQVQFKKKENERAVAARQRSHAYLKQLEEDEVWAELDYHENNDPATSIVFEKLFDQNQKDVKFDVSKQQYVATLVPPREQPVPELRNAPTSLYYASLEDLRLRMSATQQIEALMRTAHILTFQQVMSLATNVKSEFEALTELQNYGVLIQGCWVLKSIFCYEMKKKRLIAIRDYLLWLFATEGRVAKKEFMQRTQIDNDVAKEMLSKLAVVVQQRHYPPTTFFTSTTSYASSVPSNRAYWKLKLEPDAQFQEKFADVVKQYDDFWQSNKDQVIQTMDERIRNSRAKKHEERPMEVEEVKSTTRRPKAAPKLPAISAEKLTPEEELSRLLHKEFEKHGVCTLPSLRAVVDASPNASTITKEMFDSTLDSIASVIRGGYYLKSRNDPDTDKYRNILLSAFKDKSAIQRKDFTMILKQQIPGDEGPTTTAFRKLVSEVATTVKKNYWTWKTDAQT